MAQQMLENGVSFGENRQKINDNFTELYAATEANSNSIDAVQAEATSKWVLLNTVDNRSRANETAIAELRAIVEGLTTQ